MSKYNVNGWVEDLPKLQTGRSHHGCGQFFSEMNGLVKLIVKKINIVGAGPENGYFGVKLGCPIG